jgi:hypothetical protein
MALAIACRVADPDVRVIAARDQARHDAELAAQSWSDPLAGWGVPDDM